MMKANELRVGNLLSYGINDTYTDRVPYYGRNVYEVNMILDDSVKINLGHDAQQRVLFTDPKLEPIQLTEEWIERNCPDKDDFSSMYVRYNFGRVTIIRDTVKNLYLADGLKHIKKYMKYVHELQNLYFVLTGEELKIKDDEKTD